MPRTGPKAILRHMEGKRHDARPVYSRRQMLAAEREWNKEVSAHMATSLTFEAAVVAAGGMVIDANAIPVCEIVR